MGAKPGQPEGVGVGFPANQHQVWLDVTVAVAGPIPAQVMIAMTRLQRLVIRQGRENWHQVSIECGPVPALGLALVVALERR
jgi:hypothetical protein